MLDLFRSVRFDGKSFGFRAMALLMFATLPLWVVLYSRYDDRDVLSSCWDVISSITSMLIIGRP